MTEEPLTNQIEALKSELLLKNKEISEYLDKIDYLENMIMEFELSLSEKTDKSNTSVFNIQLKHLEEQNRELKKKLSFIRLENIKLKQELDKLKKGYFDASSLIRVVDSKLTVNESELVDNKEIRISEDFGKELFNYVQVTCPKCETEKGLKIPIRIINQTLNFTTISIPKNMICEHSFQVLIDKSFIIRRYQLVDYQSNLVEFSKTKDGENSHEKDQDIIHFISFPFYQEIITILRESVDDREILGTAVFTDKGMVIYALVPTNILFNIIKEFEFRNEKQLHAMTKMYIEMKDYKKIFSEYIEIADKNVIIVLIFSERVNFGMGTMIFRDLIKRVKIITKNHKEGSI